MVTVQLLMRTVYYVVTGQGKYKIAANGKMLMLSLFLDDFLGTADGISIRRSDNSSLRYWLVNKIPWPKKQTLMVSWIPWMVFTSQQLLRLSEGVDRTSADIQGDSKRTPTFNATETNANGDKISIAPSAE